MPIDPETPAFLDSIAQMGLPPLNELEPAQAREQNGLAASFSHEKEPLAQVEDRTIKGPVGEIPIRIYRPAAPAAFPILMYFHGGGWVVGDLELEDSICRTLAKQADSCIKSGNFRQYR
ncbi:MAG: alpha/beta hydrolase fold domain-containing protein [Hormoscilla sp.]